MSNDSDSRAKSNANLIPWKPGESGNPGGRPVAARNKLQGAFVNALAADFELHGKDAIERARIEDPIGYVKVVASLMPKQVEETKPLDDLSDAELTAAIALLRSRLADAHGAGAGPAGEPPTAH